MNHYYFSTSLIGTVFRRTFLTAVIFLFRSHGRIKWCSPHLPRKSLKPLTCQLDFSTWLCSFLGQREISWASSGCGASVRKNTTSSFSETSTGWWTSSTVWFAWVWYRKLNPFCAADPPSCLRSPYSASSGPWSGNYCLQPQCLWWQCWVSQEWSQWFGPSANLISWHWKSAWRSTFWRFVLRWLHP